MDSTRLSTLDIPPTSAPTLVIAPSFPLALFLLLRWIELEIVVHVERVSRVIHRVIHSVQQPELHEPLRAQTQPFDHSARNLSVRLVPRAIEHDPHPAP